MSVLPERAISTTQKRRRHELNQQKLDFSLLPLQFYCFAPFFFAVGESFLLLLRGQGMMRMKEDVWWVEGEIARKATTTEVRKERNNLSQSKRCGRRIFSPFLFLPPHLSMARDNLPFSRMHQTRPCTEPQKFGCPLSTSPSASAGATMRIFSSRSLMSQGRKLRKLFLALIFPFCCHWHKSFAQGAPTPPLLESAKTFLEGGEDHRLTRALCK